jgi:hypothetical protein
MFWAIQVHTFAVPWWDEWDTAFTVKSFEQGTLSLHDLWAFHWYTHRLVLPRIVDIILVELTHWNRQVEMVFDLACGMATAALIVWCLWLSAKSRVLVLALLPTLSILLFSMSAYYDWLLPFQITFILTDLGVAVTMAAVVRQSAGWRGWAFAVAGAMIATLSSAAGLVVWLAFLPSMYKGGRSRLLAWCAVGGGTCLAYLHGFVNPTARPSLHLLGVYVFINLGAPVGDSSYWLSERFTIASLLALAALLTIRWLLHRTLWDIMVWLELALFALATSVMTADGRATLGLWHAVTSRYLIFTAMWWVAFVVIAGLTMRDLLQRVDALGWLEPLWNLPLSRLVVGLSALGILALTIGAVNTDIAGFQEGIAWQDGLRAQQSCVAHFDTASDACLGVWYWDKQQMVDAAAYMRQHHLAIFYYTDQP